MTAFWDIRDAALKALEQQRTADAIGDAGEAAVTITVHDAAQWAALQPLAPQMAELLTTSAAEIVRGAGTGPAQVAVRHAPGAKCARCWRYTDDVGRSAEHPGVCARCVEVLT